jgi:hypothetical protein
MNTSTEAAGRRVWAVLELLDRQLVDPDGRLAGKVDDVEFELSDDPGALPHLSALLSGLGTLAETVGGRTGRWLARSERRLAGLPDRPPRVDMALVRSIGSAIEITAEREELDGHRSERWMRDAIVAHIPGSRHATE